MPLVARVALYVLALAGAVVVAFLAGMSDYEQTECHGPDYGGECDMGGLQGMLWAGIAIGGWIIVVVAIEVARTRHRRRANAETQSSETAKG